MTAHSKEAFKVIRGLFNQTLSTSNEPEAHYLNQEEDPFEQQFALQTSEPHQTKCH